MDSQASFGAKLRKVVQPMKICLVSQTGHLYIGMAPVVTNYINIPSEINNTFQSERYILHQTNRRET